MEEKEILAYIYAKNVKRVNEHTIADYIAGYDMKSKDSPEKHFEFLIDHYREKMRYFNSIRSNVRPDHYGNLALGFKHVVESLERILEEIKTQTKGSAIKTNAEG